MYLPTWMVWERVKTVDSTLLSFAAMPRMESPMMEAATKEAMEKLKQGFGLVG